MICTDGSWHAGTVNSAPASQSISDVTTVTPYNDRPVINGEFTLTRDLPVPPGRVYAAYAEPAQRRRWFRIPSTPEHARHELDFRVGGHELARGVFAPMGAEERLEYRAAFWDIVPDERVVFTYAVTVNDLRRWVSLVTIELRPQGTGTRLRHAEQYAFLAYTEDGRHDTAHLKGGTALQLNGLLAALSNPPLSRTKAPDSHADTPSPVSGSNVPTICRIWAR